MIEPLYPRAGLLGGSSSQATPKVSKLAALAAARRNRENDKTSQGPSSHPSVSLLDKLNHKAQRERSLIEKSPKLVESNGADLPENHIRSQDRRYPIRKRKNSSLSEGLSPLSNKNASLEEISAKEDHEAQEKSTPSASPSPFAKTINGISQESRPFCIDSLDTLHFGLTFSFRADSKSNAFAEPSPDDIVIKAQNTSKGSTRKGKGAR